MQNQALNTFWIYLIFVSENFIASLTSMFNLFDKLYLLHLQKQF